MDNLLNIGMEELIKVAAGETFKKIISFKWKSGTDSGKDILKEILSDSKFPEYLENCVARNLKVRTVNSPDIDVYLNDIYHPLSLTNKKTKTQLIINDCCSFEDEKITNVIGGAGQGKSTILRKIFLEQLKNGEKIPFLIDMRNMELTGVVSSLKRIIEQLNVNVVDNSIEALLMSRRIILMLDGFDELQNDKRDGVLREIVFLNTKYKLQIISTSRPETEICKEPSIQNLHVNNLNDEDVYAILEKIVHPNSFPYLKSSLESNADLISTLISPILVVLLAICYPYLDSMPKNATEFYNRIFGILYDGHDKTKNYFTRKKRSSFTSTQAYEHFCSLCFLSLYREIFSFDKMSLESISLESLKIKGLDADHAKAENFYTDVIEITGLIQRDGFENYVFLHRSIQEFHAAAFIKALATDKKTRFNERLVTNLYEKGNLVNMAKFLFFIDKENTISQVLIPLCDKLTISNWVSDESNIEIAKKIYYKCIDSAEITLLNSLEKPKVIKSNKRKITTTQHTTTIGPFNDLLTPLKFITENNCFENISAIIIDNILGTEKGQLFLERKFNLGNKPSSHKKSMPITEVIEGLGIENIILHLISKEVEKIYKHIYLYYKNQQESLDRNMKDTFDFLS